MSDRETLLALVDEVRALHPDAGVEWSGGDHVRVVLDRDIGGILILMGEPGRWRGYAWHRARRDRSFDTEYATVAEAVAGALQSLRAGLDDAEHRASEDDAVVRYLRRQLHEAEERARMSKGRLGDVRRSIACLPASLRAVASMTWGE